MREQRKPSRFRSQRIAGLNMRDGTRIGLSAATATADPAYDSRVHHSIYVTVTNCRRVPGCIFCCGTGTFGATWGYGRATRLVDAATLSVGRSGDPDRPVASEIPLTTLPVPVKMPPLQCPPPNCRTRFRGLSCRPMYPDGFPASIPQIALPSAIPPPLTTKPGAEEGNIRHCDVFCCGGSVPERSARLRNRPANSRRLLSPRPGIRRQRMRGSPATAKF